MKITVAMVTHGVGAPLMWILYCLGARAQFSVNKTQSSWTQLRITVCVCVFLFFHIFSSLKIENECGTLHITWHHMGEYHDQCGDEAAGKSPKYLIGPVDRNKEQIWNPCHAISHYLDWTGMNTSTLTLWQRCKNIHILYSSKSIDTFVKEKKKKKILI